ncbi:hypothetical protein JF66_15270 [Cryobacterium sp. MLB-32]|uniref:EsaB/YukD family protein n=1 Tax=Cryobacterium sp. MLB-32 TaxID=1529318 RepID=UPI0004E6F2A7|nr:EsaB/YukD family protein [Cryobacterium sp. MLB-32]KFF58868.1 hypothetical protein JF66_15270 [Cryobacterium sp. MLB-32]
MSGFTRLTIVGRTRKAEIVVPNEETVAALIPQLMDLLDEPTGSVARPLTLMRATGQQLDTALTLADQKVAAGELLRLLRVDEAPAPPEVADVTDVVAEARDDRRGLWAQQHRQGLGAVMIGALVGTAAWLAAAAAPGSVTLLGALFLSCLAVAAILGYTTRRWTAIGFTAAAFGLVPATSLAVAQASVWISVAPLGVAAIVGFGLAWLTVGLALGVGLGMRPALRASALALTLFALAVLLPLTGISVLETAGIVGVAAAVMCGLLPWYAMNSSGLTGLDDLVIAGRLTHRDTVLRTVNDAYRSLTWSTVAVAVPLAVTASLLAVSENGWAIALGAALAVVTALRTRAFPLAVQAIALWAAALNTVVVVALAQDHGGVSIAALVVLAAITLVVVALTPPPHTRARLRRFGNGIEMLAVVSLLPVLLGVFGIYPDLLGTF